MYWNIPRWNPILSLDAELNKRSGKEATVMARMAKGVSFQVMDQNNMIKRVEVYTLFSAEASFIRAGRGWTGGKLKCTGL